MAAAIADKLASGEVTVAEVTASEVVQLRTAQEQLSSAGVRLDTAASRYANAVGKLGKVKLDEAVELYLRHHDQQTEEINVVQLVKRFLEYKKASGASGVYQRDLKYRTRSFVKFHPESVASLSSGVMSAYFSDLRFEPQNHNNQLRVICTLINFAQSQGYLPDNIDLLKAVSRKKVRKASYPIYQPHEFEYLLDGASDEMIPPLVLQGFCGVRPNEMRRLRGCRFKRLLIIGSEEDVYEHRYRSNVTPNSLLGSLRSFEVRYDVPVVWKG